MSIKSKFLVTIIVALLLIGCNSKPTHFSPFVCDKIDLTKKRDAIVVNDFITIIKAYYLPAITVFQIEKTGSMFEKSIESELRKRGYGIGAIYGKGIKRIPLAWRVTYLNREMIRVSYHIGEDVSISRIYKLKDREYKPFSSFSAVGLDSRKFANLNFSMPKDIKPREQSVLSLAKVTASSLKIRSKPSAKSKEIATIKRGESISYSEIIMDSRGEEWVKLEGGGYMKASYLKF
jgi:hypothetical protein